jgi:hypothetical protein
MTDPTTTTAIALLIGFFSPLIVDALKRDTWKPSQTLLLGAVISIVIYVGLHAALGTLTFPVTPEFVIELVSVFGLQQAGYAAYFKDRNRVVEVPTATNVITDKVVVTDSATIETVPGQ